MNIYKPLRIALFSYEIFRFTLFVVHGNAVFTTIQGWQWTAPNALFPLMALFLLIDLDRYAAFLPLSVAGKSIAAILMLWSVFSSLVSGGVETYFLDAVIAIGDIFSIFAYTHVLKGVNKHGEKTERVEGVEE
ncbi:MAG: hypothetical protein LBI40_02620 [Treponema sp.]|jgi:hypothetical protein|nr:hypothetical protein [Treponema sp.]